MKVPPLVSTGPHRSLCVESSGDAAVHGLKDARGSPSERTDEGDSHNALTRPKGRRCLSTFPSVPNTVQQYPTGVKSPRKTENERNLSCWRVVAPGKFPVKGANGRLRKGARSSRLHPCLLRERGVGARPKGLCIKSMRAGWTVTPADRSSNLAHLSSCVSETELDVFLKNHVSRDSGPLVRYTCLQPFPFLRQLDLAQLAQERNTPRQHTAVPVKARPGCRDTYMVGGPEPNGYSRNHDYLPPTHAREAQWMYSSEQKQSSISDFTKELRDGDQTEHCEHTSAYMRSAIGRG